MNRVTGKVESTTNATLKFVDSPFELRWDKTLQYFKTGFTFDVKVNKYLSAAQVTLTLGYNLILNLTQSLYTFFC